MNCDDCKYYHWYSDHCDKYDCTVDARSVCNGFEPHEGTIRAAMVYATEEEPKVMLKKDGA